MRKAPYEVRSLVLSLDALMKHACTRADESKFVGLRHMSIYFHCAGYSLSLLIGYSTDLLWRDGPATFARVYRGGGGSRDKDALLIALGSSLSRQTYP